MLRRCSGDDERESAPLHLASTLSGTEVFTVQGTFAVSSYTSGFAGMIKEFGTTSEILAVGQMLFLVGLGARSGLSPLLN